MALQITTQDRNAFTIVKQTLETIQNGLRLDHPEYTPSRFQYICLVTRLAKQAGHKGVTNARIHRLIGLGLLEREYDGGGCGYSIAITQ